MIRTKQNLSKLLQRALREEAQNIDPPSCQQLWTELQQRPEFTAIENKAEQFFLTQGNKGRVFKHFEKASISGSFNYCDFYCRPFDPPDPI